MVNRERHEKGVDPEGKAWKPLSPMTLASGEKRKGGPLKKTGRMLQTFNYQVQGNTLRLGFGAGDGFKAIFHQDGTNPYTITPKKAQALKFGGVIRKRVNHPGLPARPLVGFPDSDKRRVVEVLDDHLKLVLNRVP